MSTDSNNDGLPMKTYRVSRAQLKVLVEKAGPEVVEAALIQNGNATEGFTDFVVSRKQLEAIVQKAGPDAIQKALIQNGNSTEGFMDGT